MNDLLSAESLLAQLCARGILGVSAFDADGKVVSVAGAPAAWTPAVGGSITDAPLFAGMWEAIEEVRAGHRTLSLASVAIGGDPAAALDIDVIWLEPMQQYVVLTRLAADRVAGQAAAAQAIRETRLLEERIREQREKLAEQSEMMTLFVRFVPAAVAMLDGNLDIVAASERWKQEFGDPAMHSAGVVNSPLGWPGVADGLRLDLESGVPTSKVVKTESRGRPAWRRLAQAPWRRADRSVGGAILFCEDVTEAMRKAENLRARIEDLHKLGAEMDSLGKAVSDDLRAPLRQVDFFSRFLLDADPSSPDWARQDYLVQIRASVARIDRMMAALERYMRLTERDLSPTRFDLADAVMVAAAELREDMSAAGIAIRICESLSVEADLTLVSGLFRRLIDNVVKYAGEGTTIIVDFFEEPEGVLTRFTDDGRGIAPHLRRRAFGFFERLDAPATISGEGMGLAECRKIADLHGGAMTFDPDFDAGLRALISIPRNARRSRPGGVR